VLPRAQRIVTPLEIRHLIRRGKKSAHPLVICYSETADTPRAAVVVSKDVGNAPTRNRVRRRIRHILAAELPGRSLNVVVRALPLSATASWPELRAATIAVLGGLSEHA
jgi:ribonuclease P protein component